LRLLLFALWFVNYRHRLEHSLHIEWNRRRRGTLSAYVESNPESGTSFKLYFPLGLLGEAPATDQATKTSFETTESSNGHGTILVVEDEKNMMKLLRRVLERHGYKILTASDGETAVDIYQHNTEAIDAVLLDLGLPRMTGSRGVA
jgi:hypothetical protein